LTRRRRLSRRVLWQRRLAALGALIVLAAVVLPLVLRFTGGPPRFVGVWGGAQPMLGSARWSISDAGDGDFRVSGMKVQGKPLLTLHMDDGKLMAQGEAGGATWHVTVASAADGNQIVPPYEPGPGQTAQRLRFTRVPALAP
jgi:hypothetical protein